MLALAASSGADLRLRIVVILAGFLLAGFLAGVRTLDRRPSTAVAAWALGWLLWTAVVIVLWIVNAFGGPAEPEFGPGGNGQSVITLVASLVVAVLGAFIADRRYSGRSSRSRRRF